MLKYSFSLNREDINMKEIEWHEKYAAQDLSFFSGVTSPSYHLDKFKRIYVEYDKDEPHAPFDISAENVLRDGYIVLLEKQYDAISSSTVSYAEDGSAVVRDFSYIVFNDEYKMVSGNSVSIKNALVEFSVGDIREKDIALSINNGKCTLDTIIWIENSTVFIDGNEYKVDFEGYSEDGTLGVLVDKNGNYLSTQDVCNCSGMKVHKFNKSKEVTKFVIKPSEFEALDIEYVATCGYENFIVYDGERYVVKKMYGDVECPQYTISTEATGQSGSVDFSIKAAPIFQDWEYLCLGSIFTNGKSRVNIDIGNGGVTYATRDNILSSSTYEIFDLTYFDAYVEINGVKVMVQSTIVEKPFGDLLLIHLNNEANGVKIGDKIEASFNAETFDVEVVSYVEGDDEEPIDRYLIYDGTKYDIVSGLVQKIETSGESEDNFYYIDNFNANGDAMVKIGDELVPMKYSDGKATRYGIGVSGDSSNTLEYNVLSADGVTILGERYEVFSAISISSDETSVFKEFIRMNNASKILYKVNDIMGSSTLICEAFIEEGDLDAKYRLSYDVGAASYGSANQDDVEFRKVNESIYYHELIPSIVYKAWFEEDKSIYERILNDNIKIMLKNGYATLRLPMTINGVENPLQDNITENQFFKTEKDKAINKIVDMEKDVYTPKTLKGNDRFNGSKTQYNPIYEIDFNLHFRVRDDNWKVIEDIKGENEIHGWTITDYPIYSAIIDTRGDELMSASDLVGLMGFDDVDVLYQKSALSRSFLRLSFYDSTDSQTQNLLGMSCVFMDGSRMFKTYMDNSRKEYDSYKLVRDDEEEILLNKISASSEKYNGDNGVSFDENRRISSRLTVKNKYESKGSSEGFYMYIFREYSSGLHYKPIFMKAEFNHAKIGHTIPMIVPMEWKENNGVYYPNSALTLSQLSEDYISGYPLESVASQLYVPLYAVFDYENKEYGYVFDDRYVKDDEGISTLNLFELKIRDDSDNIDMTKNVYRINANEKFRQSQ